MKEYPIVLWIAFKSFVSLRSITTNVFRVVAQSVLWIAFKSFVSLRSITTEEPIVSFDRCCELLSKVLYLCAQSQRHNWLFPVSACCELLSKVLYLCAQSQPLNDTQQAIYVVNCFQKFCIFALYHNQVVYNLLTVVLWIAFKSFVSLHSITTKQFKNAEAARCELLSKVLYLCTLSQRSEAYDKRKYVVNCFQKFCIFALYHNLTAHNMVCLQVVNCFQKFCIFALYHNASCQLSPFPTVVNCFQKFCIFALYHNQGNNGTVTWDVVNCFQKFCIFALYHNVGSFVSNYKAVVNCFQKFCIFALYHNFLAESYWRFELWIAFKSFVSLHSITTAELANQREYRCELLSKVLYLCTLSQHYKHSLTHWFSCELLSKVLYLCTLSQPQTKSWFP